MSVRVGMAEAGASVADLGTLLPITAALVLANGIDAAAALGVAGALFIVAGIYYGVPMPVQPIKAAAAIAIATRASAEVIAAAGVLLGLVLLVLAVTRAAAVLHRLFPKPVIRGNQLGVGILLVVAAERLVRGGDATDLVVAAVLVGVLVATARTQRMPVALGLVLGGIAWSLLQGGSASVRLAAEMPDVAVPGSAAFATALTLLVIPQLPLTLGNAVVGTADLEREYYGARARRVTPSALCATAGAANVLTGFLGGMPLCHGSSGATAYHRFGARTGGVGVVIGAVLVVSGVLFGATALDVFALIPAPVLAALLAYTGIRHAMLVADQRGAALVVAISMGIVGGATRNLSYAMAAGIPLYLVLIGARKAVRAG